MLTAFHCEPSADVCNRLVRRVAERDGTAFRRLYHQSVRRVFRQASDGLGDPAAAVAVTKAVFVEVWRLAPVSVGRHEDAIGWLTDIAARRVMERVATGASWSVIGDHDQHVAHELAAVLETGGVGR